LSGYHDHVIRDGEPTVRTARYVLRNPVRAGLARRTGEYPFAGSDAYSWQELEEVLGTG
jgi:putative transposase